jgi:hydroxypyruvate reductase
MSDVIGDDFSVVASGPTVPDNSTYADALDVLDQYDISVPQTVRDRLERGRRGVESETPSAGDPAFDRVSMHILATSYEALDAAASIASDHGFEPLLLSAGIRGEAREAAKTHVAIAEQVLETGQPVEPPAVLLSGGETTVTVCEDPGDGGPNQEFGLSAALEIAAERITVASVDTDGIDGSSSAAGALVDTDTIPDRLSRPRAQDALGRNDALPVLDRANDLVRTGPTKTNVNDLRVVVVDDGSDSEDENESS